MIQPKEDKDVVHTIDVLVYSMFSKNIQSILNSTNLCKIRDQQTGKFHQVNLNMNDKQDRKISTNINDLEPCEKKYKVITQ